MPYASDGRKICSACRAELPVSEFNRNARAADGLNNQCAPCSRESRRRYRQKLGPCTVPGCRNMAVGRLGEGGLCSTHYRWRQEGKDLASPVRHRAASGQGSITSDGYRVLMINGKKGIREHRYVMEQVLGRYLWPWEKVHHRNGVRADNRPENLELWITQQPSGQRLDDLLDFMISHYADELKARLA